MPSPMMEQLKQLQSGAASGADMAEILEQLQGASPPAGGMGEIMEKLQNSGQGGGEMAQALEGLPTSGMPGGMDGVMEMFSGLLGGASPSPAVPGGAGSSGGTSPLDPLSAVPADTLSAFFEKGQAAFTALQTELMKPWWQEAELWGAAGALAAFLAALAAWRSAAATRRAEQLQMFAAMLDEYENKAGVFQEYEAEFDRLKKAVGRTQTEVPVSPTVRGTVDLLLACCRPEVPHNPPPLWKGGGARRKIHGFYRKMIALWERRGLETRDVRYLLSRRSGSAVWGTLVLPMTVVRTFDLWAQNGEIRLDGTEADRDAAVKKLEQEWFGAWGYRKLLKRFRPTLAKAYNADLFRDLYTVAHTRHDQKEDPAL